MNDDEEQQQQQQQRQAQQPASSNTAPSPVIWFQLVDADGRALTAQADFVYRTALSLMMVGALKDAVQAKYANGKLRDVSAGDLKVFLGQEQLAADQPLLPNAVVLDTHGATMGGALLVVVPARDNDDDRPTAVGTRRFF